VMKRLGASYAYWYNLKHEHTGHVFQDRFKSEAVEDDSYLMTVIRYIHRNPVDAGIVSKPEDYRWSSCGDYYGAKSNSVGLTKTDFILNLFSDDKNTAIIRMCSFEGVSNEDQCIDVIEQKRISLDRAKQVVKEKMNGQPIGELQNMSVEDRNRILKQLKEIEGLSLRQIAMVTGLTVHRIHKA